MSLGYAEKLSYREDLGGQLGSREHFDSGEQLVNKIAMLASMVKEARRVVVFTGAGISTSCGIPDFRGPNGIWTLQRANKPLPQMKTSFVAAKPSYTHQALVSLLTCGKLSYLVSQNVDGLHLRSGIPRESMAELHGNCFAERCENCNHEYIRDFEIETVGFQCTKRWCVQPSCGGRLRDHILDWEDALPEDELEAAERYAKEADLAICLGTSLQITPACNLPLFTVKAGGKMVIINLQKTPKDKKAALVIHARCDDVMRQLMQDLHLQIPTYTRTDTVAINLQQHPPRLKPSASLPVIASSQDGSGELQQNGSGCTRGLCGPLSNGTACVAQLTDPPTNGNAHSLQLNSESSGTSNSPTSLGAIGNGRVTAAAIPQVGQSADCSDSKQADAIYEASGRGPTLNSQPRDGSYPFTLSVQNQYGSKWPVPLLQQVEFEFKDPQLAAAVKSSPPFKVTRTVKLPGEYPVTLTLRLSQHADEGRREIKVPYVVRVLPHPAQGHQGQQQEQGEEAGRRRTRRSQQAAADVLDGLQCRQQVEYASFITQEVRYDTCGQRLGGIRPAVVRLNQEKEFQVLLAEPSQEDEQLSRKKRSKRSA